MVSSKPDDTMSDEVETTIADSKLATPRRVDQFCYLSLSEFIPTPKDDTAGVYFEWALLPPDCSYSSNSGDCAVEATTEHSLTENLEWNRTDTNEIIDGDLMYSSKVQSVDFGSTIRKSESEALKLIQCRILVRAYLDCETSDEEDANVEPEPAVVDTKAARSKDKSGKQKVEEAETPSTTESIKKGLVGESIIELLPLVHTGEILHQVEFDVKKNSTQCSREDDAETTFSDENGEADTKQLPDDASSFRFESLSLAIQVYCDPQLAALFRDGRLFTINAAKVSDLPASWLVDPQELIPIPEPVGKKQPPTPIAEPPEFWLVVELPTLTETSDGIPLPPPELCVSEGTLVAATPVSPACGVLEKQDGSEVAQLVESKEKVVEDDISTDLVGDKDDDTGNVKSTEPYIEFKNDVGVVFVSCESVTKLKQSLRKFDELPVKLRKRGPMMRSEGGELEVIPGQPDEEILLGTVCLGDLLSSQVTTTVGRLSLEYFAPIVLVNEDNNEEVEETPKRNSTGEVDEPRNDKNCDESEQQENEEPSNHTNNNCKAKDENVCDVLVTAEFNILVNKALIPPTVAPPIAMQEPKDLIEPRPPIVIPELTVEEEFETGLGAMVQKLVTEYVEAVRIETEKHAQVLGDSDTPPSGSNTRENSSSSNNQGLSSKKTTSTLSTASTNRARGTLVPMVAEKDIGKQVTQQLNTSGEYAAMHRQLREVVKNLVQKYFHTSSSERSEAQSGGESDVCWRDEDPDLACARAYSFVMQLVHRSLNNQYAAACNCSADSVEPWRFADPSIAGTNEMATRELDFMGGLAVDLETALDFEAADVIHQQRVGAAEEALVKLATMIPSGNQSNATGDGSLNLSQQTGSLHPWNDTITPTLVADVWCDYGMYCLRQGESGIELAGECLRSAIALSFEHLTSSALYGILLMEINQFDTAQVFFADVLRKVETLSKVGTSISNTDLNSITTIVKTLLYLTCQQTGTWTMEEIWQYPTANDTITPTIQELYHLLAEVATECCCLYLPDVVELAMKERQQLCTPSMKRKEYVTETHHDIVTNDILTGWKYVILGKPQIAIGNFQSALELDGNNILVRCLLGNSMYVLGDLRVAQVHLQRAVALHDKPRKKGTKSGAKLPTSKLAFNQLLVDSGPHTISTTRNRLAELLLATDEFANALTLLEKDCKLHPNSASCWRNIGWCLYNMEQFAAAEKALAESNAIDNTNPDTWGLLSLVSHSLNQTEIATKCLEEAIEQGLSDSQLLYQLGLRYQSLGDSGHAEILFKRALSVTNTQQSKYQDGIKSKLQLGLARTLVNQKRLDDAITAYKVICDWGDGINPATLNSATLELEQLYQFYGSG